MVSCYCIGVGSKLKACVYMCVCVGGRLIRNLDKQNNKKNRKKEKENPFSPIPPYSWKGEGKRSAL